ncbi:unnamed protein product [Ceutorhynchus assimilis]|uniref:STING ligand-binding domain-containing protein n=1 Tax=Ceutorhynchus assimilis TaxID=467358 RepID=A0A9N9MZR0_9CUCU|nr:unnamed protein product [Ceutorhynchus assimilis]
MTRISKEVNLKRVCVAQKGNKHYYPKTVPRKRESMNYIHAAILLIIIIIHFGLTEDWIQLFGLYSFVIVFYYSICCVYRLILFIYELRHSNSRYKNNYQWILKAAFYFRPIAIIFLIVHTFYLTFYVTRHGFPKLQNDYWLLFVPFLFILHRFTALEDFPINDSLNISKDKGLDYGSGMAYSFFYGYLNYMLDKAGEPNKNLKEMMQCYESQHKIEFEVYKIFILIPKSLICFESVNSGSHLMDMCSTLPEKKITVAGVRDRVYKNSVYSIKHPASNNVYYVCTEYATPLKTFKEVVKHNTAHTDYYNRHKNDILLQFYLTLKQILERNKMDSMCELVFYEDRDGEKAHHDVGRILLSKIAEIKKSENSKDV